MRPTWRGGPHLPSRGLPSRTQLEALRDQRKPLSTHYGALLGLAVLGPLAVHKLVMPILPGYLQTLQPLLEPPMAPMDGAPADGAASSAAGATAKKGAARARTARQLEALRLHGAALHVCGSYFYRQGHVALPAPPPKPPEGPHAAAATAATAIAAASLAGAVAPPPRNRNRAAAAGGGGGEGDGTSASAGALSAGGNGSDGSALPLSDLLSSYQTLYSEFGPALTSYAWSNDWFHEDSPGLLHAML